MACSTTNIPVVLDAIRTWRVRLKVVMKEVPSVRGLVFYWNREVETLRGKMTR